MTEKISTEYRARVYDDTHGYYTEVKPDGDGLGLCEITYSDGDSKEKYPSIIISWDMAEALAKAILDIKPKNVEVE